jgi:hypothetical protein
MLPWAAFLLAVMAAGALAAEGAVEEPHTTIVLQTAGHHQRLRHTITQEVVDLPPCAGKWCICYSENGAYVHNGDSSLWVKQFLQHSLHRLGSRLFVAHRGGTSTWLSEWLQEHKVTFIKIGGLAVGGKVAILKAAELKRDVEGSRVLWELRYVHAWLGVQGHWSKSSAWLSDNVSRWSRSLHKKYGVGPLHLRKAPCRKPGWEEAGWEAAGSLLETTCSTFALALLLSNWSHSSSQAFAAGSKLLLTKWLEDAFKAPQVTRATHPDPTLHLEVFRLCCSAPVVL